MDRIGLLVVDDSDEVRRDLRTVFRLTPDLTVVGEATNGLEAVALAAQLHPDVVLMDLRMPAGDGFEATRQIKRRGLARAVVVLTIYAQDGPRAQAAAMGADAFVDKAAGVESLLAAVRQVAQASALPPGSAEAQPREVAHAV